MNKAIVAVVRCDAYRSDLVYAAVLRSVELLGGISEFVKPGARVLVKPNLLMAKDPEFGITTHPEIIRAVVRVLKTINCRIFIGDGPSVWGSQAENIDQVYESTQARRIAEEEGVGLVKFDKRRWRGKFPLAGFLDECDHVVSVPKFKTHSLTTMTAAVKNLYGLVSDTYKTELHRRYFDNRDFAKVVLDVYSEVQPALTVVDGIIAMEGDGPATSGKLRELGLIFAGQDAVALDAILALVMGIHPLDVLTTQEAVRRKIGVADVNSIQVLGESLETIIADEPFELPKTSVAGRIPRPVINVVRKLIRFYPKVRHANCIRCQACVYVCPQKIITLRNDRIVIDYSQCICCFCCQEACPAAAIKVRKSILAKIIGM